MKTHTAGRYTVRTNWNGRVLSYDVMLQGGLLIAAGFDMLSMSESDAVGKLLARCMVGKFR